MNKTQIITLCLGCVLLGFLAGGAVTCLFPPVRPTSGQPEASLPTVEAATYSLDDLLDAIEWVESKGEANAVGDNGEAVGVYQIHKIYVDDLNRFSDWFAYRAKYNYDDRWNRHKSRQMVSRYVWYYTTKIMPELTLSDCGMRELEAMARIHNGGPDGYKSPATKKYWLKVKARMLKVKQG